MRIPFSLLVLSVLLASACGDTGTARNAPVDTTNNPPPPTMTPPTVDDGGASVGCAEVKQGCPCDEPGKTDHCKIGPFHYGSLVECIVGDATCTADGTWSRCIPNGSPPIIVTEDGAAPSADDSGVTQ